MSDTEQDLSGAVAPTESHEVKSESTYAENIKALRAQRDEARQQILWMQQQQQQARSQAPQAVVEEDFDYSSLEKDEYPDGKKLSKALSSLDKKLKGYDQKLSEKDRKIAILETAMQHKDFNDIVTAENIKKYIESDEDNLESVQKANNPGLKIYNLIKKSAVYQADQTAKKPVSQEKQRIDDQAAKPKQSSLGVRSEAVSVAAATSNSRMTREQKSAVWAETMAYARKLSDTFIEKMKLMGLAGSLQICGIKRSN